MEFLNTDLVTKVAIVCVLILMALAVFVNILYYRSCKNEDEEGMKLGKELLTDLFSRMIAMILVVFAFRIIHYLMVTLL